MTALLKHLPGVLTLCAALLIGFWILPDYGISWDEDDQRKLGEINYRFLFHGDPALHTFVNRDYGPAIEWPLIALEKSIGISDSRQAFQFRHACIHFIFWIGLLFAYRLLYGLYHQPWLATAGVWLLLAMPHIYAHSFFNSKDIAFLVFHLLLFFYAYQLYRKARWVDAVLLGMVSAIAVNLRVLGLVTVGLVVFFLLTDLYRARAASGAFRGQLRNLGLFFLFFLLTLVALWPYLWENPPQQFIYACRNMAHFRWEFLVWFNGNMERSTALPWTYLPLWIAITTPLTTLLTGIGGMIWFRYRHWRGEESVFTDLRTRMNYLFLMVVVSAFLMVWVLNPVLLDGWRHFYYIFPPFVLLGIYGLDVLLQSRFRWWVGAAIGAGTIHTLVFMAMHHPFQHAYFNLLAN